MFIELKTWRPECKDCICIEFYFCGFCSRKCVHCTGWSSTVLYLVFHSILKWMSVGMNVSSWADSNACTRISICTQKCILRTHAFKINTWTACTEPPLTKEGSHVLLCLEMASLTPPTPQSLPPYFPQNKLQPLSLSDWLMSLVVAGRWVICRWS